jgi:hypothetical protein
MKQTAKKKAAKPFECPVIYADGIQCSLYHSDMGSLCRKHNAKKSEYKFHPKYHKKAPAPKAKKPSLKKWTGWAVIGDNTKMQWIYEVRLTRQEAREGAKKVNGSGIGIGTYRVSRIGEL